MILLNRRRIQGSIAYFRLGEVVSAEKLLQPCINVKSGMDPDLLVIGLCNIAWVRLLQGRYTDAVERAMDAVNISRKQFGTGSIEVCFYVYVYAFVCAYVYVYVFFNVQFRLVQFTLVIFWYFFVFFSYCDPFESI